MNPGPTRRFYSLDVLRGVAALSVVLWHWQHFFLPFNPRGLAFQVERLPGYAPLHAIYHYGDGAVQLFFCLSGFVFFWLYSRRVAERTISFGSFSVLRLSRLYPLHFATLLFAAAGQMVHAGLVHAPFVYRFNDVRHFVLNLFFVSAWGLERGTSFNGPVWSVSVEVLVYAVFFVFCRVFRRNLPAMLAAIALGYFSRRLDDAIGNGVMCFFIGGVAFVLYEALARSAHVRRWAAGAALLAAVAWGVTLTAPGPGAGEPLAGAPWILQKSLSSFAVVALFPLTIVALALVETCRGTLGARLAFVGDLSYSSYLLHFPLQLATAIVVAKLAVGQEIYYAPWFMASFFLVLVLLSLASHRWFELPLQRLFRRRTGSAS